ncbi:hypothetical protein [Streptomyces sp. LS1784]|uniref:hypothetical protein n=1 Tax=Streptomyces sp. LS1784 TaxID=2851533 RepID=UPI001CCC9BAB|nr:hypothetical protein [Streptomyces sp. LS1784]
MSQPTAREQLLNALCDPTEYDADVLGLPEHEASHLLDAYRTEVREQVAQEIDAAWQRSRTEHPDEPAMLIRRLGLAQAARVARSEPAGGAR